jgi:DNA topoisomerase IB
VGELTALLAPRCDRLMSVDAHPDAVGAARQRVADQSAAWVSQMVVPDAWPGAEEGMPFVLVVLSEIGYHISAAGWLLLAQRVAESTTDDGVFVACHWRRDFPQRTQATDQLHRALDEVLGWPTVAWYADADRHMGQTGIVRRRGAETELMRLRMVSPDDVGWTRRRSGRGFVYIDETGALLGPEDVARIKDLVIPPAWTDVWISRYPNGHIQAVGTDIKGRRQYLYHEQWRLKRDLAKHEHVLAMARRLPRARREVTEALHAEGMPLDRALATAFRLLDLGYFRIGSDTYATENGSYGLTTLERRHVRRVRRRLLFEFEAKSGVLARIEIVDPVVLASVEMMRRRRNRDEVLLAYRQRGRWSRLAAVDVNDYLKDLLGEETSAKDFRTWHGTVHAAVALARQSADSERARRRAVAAAMREVAEHLGNTPTVARGSYVDARVIDLFSAGRTIAAAVDRADTLRPNDPRRQQILERAVRKLLDGSE